MFIFRQSEIEKKRQTKFSGSHISDCIYQKEAIKFFESILSIIILILIFQGKIFLKSLKIKIILS